MAKKRTTFVCNGCGSTFHRWMGKCPDCGTWDSLEEHIADAGASKDPQRGLVENWSEQREGSSGGVAIRSVPVGQIDPNVALASRAKSGISEFDRVLGGGIVPGSAVLIGGDPGIGKSTLLLQAAGAWASNGARVLYVSSEESLQQIKMRADRIGAGELDELHILADTNLARIIEETRKVLGDSDKPPVLVIDSIQLVYKSDLPAAPGSVSQLRRCAGELVYLAKVSGISVVLVGHVTKEGHLAGPRLLEHLVDAVLYVEGDRYHTHRIVRAVKNRFGTTLEVGLFEMGSGGLREVSERSLVPLGTSAEGRPGSVICPVMTGTRCMLVELQALTATGFPGSARRKASGLDANRLAMLIAVLEQHGGLRLADRDIFASAVGGIRVHEPASDLALALAIAGAHFKRRLGVAASAAGEVGLGGEVRTVGNLEARIREAARLGCRSILLPKAPQGMKDPIDGIGLVEGIELVRVASLSEAIGMLA